MNDERRPLVKRRRAWDWGEWVTLTLLILLPVIGLFLHLQYHFFILEFLALVALSTLSCAILVGLQGDWRLVGPHARFDLVALARRGRSSVVRVLYLLALLGGLGFVSYRNHGDFRLLYVSSIVDRNDLARLSESFSTAVLFMQNLAVLILTPAYLATAMTEERERRTLELLQTTQLHDREIVLGKLTARLGHLGGVLLAGLPVLSVALFMGGLDVVTLLANFAVTAMYLWTAGCICITLSATSRSNLEAVVGSYAAMILLGGCCSCLTTVAGGSFPLVLSPQDYGGNNPSLLHVLWILFVAHALVSLFCLVIAVGAVRPLVDRSRLPRFPVMPRELFEDAEPWEKANETVGPAEYEPIRGDPLLWKEWRGPPWRRSAPWRRMPSPDLAMVYLVLLPFFSLALLSFCIALGNDGAEVRGTVARGLAFVMLWIACLRTAYRMAGSVARERQRQTLDSLLTLPVDRNEILVAKLVGGVLHAVPWAVVTFLLLCLGMESQVTFRFFVQFNVISVAFMFFLANLGQYFSVTSRTVLQAQTKMMLTVFVLLTAGFVDSWAAETLGDRLWLSGCMDAFNEIVNPFMIGRASRNSWMSEEEILSRRGAQTMATVLTLVGLSFLLWKRACRAFAREQS